MPASSTDWIVAVGTVVMAVVAIVAIFQDKIRACLTRPKLQVSVNVAPPDCHKTKLRVGYRFVGGLSALTMDPRELPREQEFDTYYFRLRVANVGNQKAESVEVFAAELSRRQADGSFKMVDSFLPMNLVWSHFREMFLPAISPDTYKHCDLAHILHPKGRETVPGEHTTWPNIPENKTILSLDTVVKPYTQSHLLQFGTYRLTIIVAAANAKALRRTLEITLTGDWYDDEERMLGEGIGIRLLD